MASKRRNSSKRRAPEASVALAHPEEIYDFMMEYGETSKWRARLTMEFEAGGAHENFGFVVRLHEDDTEPHKTTRKVAENRYLCPKLFDDARNVINRSMRAEKEDEKRLAVLALSPGGTPIASADIDEFMRKTHQNNAWCDSIGIRYNGRLFEIEVYTPATITHDGEERAYQSSRRVAYQRYLCKELLDEAKAAIDEMAAAREKKKAIEAAPDSGRTAELLKFMWRYCGMGDWRAELAGENSAGGMGFAIYAHSGDGKCHRVAWRPYICAELFADADAAINALIN